jgi:hypothetical protein
MIAGAAIVAWRMIPISQGRKGGLQSGAKATEDRSLTAEGYTSVWYTIRETFRFRRSPGKKTWPVTGPIGRAFIGGRHDHIPAFRRWKPFYL